MITNIHEALNHVNNQTILNANNKDDRTAIQFLIDYTMIALQYLAQFTEGENR